MVERETNKSRGFGFVTYADEKGIDNVLKTNNYEIQGKRVS